MPTNINIYKYIDFKRYLFAVVDLNSNVYRYKAQLAEAAGCQRSYLSQVLNGDAMILPEHAMGLAHFWKLSTQESEYFLTMVLYARAGSKALKDHLKEKLMNARKDQEDLVKRISDKVVLPEASAAIFYSNWQYLAINVLISIPQFRSVQAIAQRLSLSEDVIKKSLRDLEKLGLVYNSGGNWMATNSTLHVPRDSQFNSLNHSHWRKKAVENSFLAEEGSVHYTSVCTLSRDDVIKIKELVLQLIDGSRKIVAPSQEEELYCLTCDWFRI